MLQSTKALSIFIFLALFIFLIAWGVYILIQSSGEPESLQLIEQPTEGKLILNGYTPPTGPPPTD